MSPEKPTMGPAPRWTPSDFAGASNAQAATPPAAQLDALEQHFQAERLAFGYDNSWTQTAKQTILQTSGNLKLSMKNHRASWRPDQIFAAQLLLGLMASAMALSFLYCFSLEPLWRDANSNDTAVGNALRCKDRGAMWLRDNVTLAAVAIGAAVAIKQLLRLVTGPAREGAPVAAPESISRRVRFASEIDASFDHELVANVEPLSHL